MKKSLLVAALLALTLTACGKKEEQPAADNTAASAAAAAASDASSAASAAGAAASDAASAAGAAAQAGTRGDGGAEGVDGARALRGAQGEEEVEEGRGGADVDFALVFGEVLGDDFDVGLDGLNELGVEFGDEVVVELLLGRLLQHVPREGVDIPGMAEAQIAEIHGNGALGFGEGRDQEVGAEGDGGGQGSLAVDHSMFSKDNNFARCRDHEGGGHR